MKERSARLCKEIPTTKKFIQGFLYTSDDNSHSTPAAVYPRRAETFHFIPTLQLQLKG
ncbi:hypothetical protein AASFL403_14030 [Paenibacillus nuruki]|nr:hypothetical protein AASFL403_14030 [Paenibacillus nuruki]